MRRGLGRVLLRGPAARPLRPDDSGSPAASGISGWVSLSRPHGAACPPRRGAAVSALPALHAAGPPFGLSLHADGAPLGLSARVGAAPLSVDHPRGLLPGGGPPGSPAPRPPPSGGAPGRGPRPRGEGRAPGGATAASAAATLAA